MNLKPFPRSHTLQATCGTLPCNENELLTPTLLPILAARRQSLLHALHLLFGLLLLAASVFHHLILRARRLLWRLLLRLWRLLFLLFVLLLFLLLFFFIFLLLRLLLWLLGVFPTVAEEFQAKGQVVARRVGLGVQAQRAFVFIDGLIEELGALSLLL